MMRARDTTSPDRRPARIAGAVGACALLLWVSFRAYTGICNEDALITFRYARNIARGAGFVYNEGERVLGTSSPLYALALAAAGVTAGPESIPTAANVIGMAAGLAAGFLLFASLRRLGFGTAVAACAMALFYAHPDTLWSVSAGMETPLVLALMAAGLYCLAHGRPGLAAAASALLVLTRPDGLIWAVMVIGWILLSDRREGARALLVFAAITAPWLAFSTLYFGSPVPHTVIAKRIIGRGVPASGGPAAFALYTRWILGAFDVPLAGRLAPVAFWSALALVACGDAAVLRRGRSPAVILVAFPAALLLAFWLGGAPREFRWYLVPVIWCLVPCGTIGAAVLQGGRGGRYSVVRRIAAVLLAACVVAGVAAGDRARFEFERLWQTNEDSTRRAIGEWLRENTPPGCSVAMEAIGYQGVYSGRRIIDLAGLISPDVVRIRRESRSNAEAFHRIIRELKPDYIVLRTLEVERNIHFHGGQLFETEEQRTCFARCYRPVKQFSAPVPSLWRGLSRLTIYRKVGGD